MRHFLISPYEMVGSLWRNRYLIKASVNRDVLGRYRGSAMGILWSFFNPLLMLSVYTIVFSVVFKARWGMSNGSKVEFALVLFAGLIIFNIFSDCINRSPQLILSNVNYVKKVIFPLEVLPAITLFSALFHALISFAVVDCIRFVFWDSAPHHIIDPHNYPALYDADYGVKLGISLFRGVFTRCVANHWCDYFYFDVYESYFLPGECIARKLSATTLFKPLNTRD